jgi:hypothetical protein
MIPPLKATSNDKQISAIAALERLILTPRIALETMMPYNKPGNLNTVKGARDRWGWFEFVIPFSFGVNFESKFPGSIYPAKRQTQKSRSYSKKERRQKKSVDAASFGNSHYRIPRRDLGW